MLPFNRDIDIFLMQGELHIEQNWAMEQLSLYLQELELLRAGAAYSDLGISQRRAGSMPGIITSQRRVINDPKLLRDPELTPSGSFAHLRLNGVMRSQDGASSQGINSLVDDLNAANDNPAIEGILLEVNTGGGDAMAGQILQSAVAGSIKAVVVLGHMVASAGIMGTLPADEIIASGEMARFGSIGTFITLDKSIQRWYNHYYEDIYADKSTNKNEEFRAYLNGDKGPLIKSINKTNDIFVASVQKHRELKGDLEETLSGRMFFGPEAKRRGLVDGIGNFHHAINRLEANVRRRKKAM
jgi:ClpP class serine protease